VPGEYNNFSQRKTGYFEMKKHKPWFNEKKLHGPSPRANYTNRATAAYRRSDCQLLQIEGAMWSA
jgi:hypothetical protein